MTRALIDVNGIKIAKPGYDVGAAEENLLFSNIGAHQSIYLSGFITFQSVYSYSPPPSFNEHRATLTFGKTFASPPIVYCGVREVPSGSSTSRNHVPIVNYLLQGAGYSNAVPSVLWVVTTTEVVFSSLFASSSTYLGFNYCIMENTL